MDLFFPKLAKRSVGVSRFLAFLGDFQQPFPRTLNPEVDLLSVSLKMFEGCASDLRWLIVILDWISPNVGSCTFVLLFFSYRAFAWRSRELLTFLKNKICISTSSLQLPMLSGDFYIAN